MSILTREEVRALREMCEKATPGPWVFGYSGDPKEEPEDHSVIAVGQGMVCQTSQILGMLQAVVGGETRNRTVEEQVANGVLLAACRQAIPDLIETVEHLCTAIEALQSGKVEVWRGVRTIVRKVGRESIMYDAEDDEEGVTILVLDAEVAKRGRCDSL